MRSALAIGAVATMALATIGCSRDDGEPPVTVVLGDSITVISRDQIEARLADDYKLAVKADANSYNTRMRGHVHLLASNATPVIIEALETALPRCRAAAVAFSKIHGKRSTPPVVPPQSILRFFSPTRKPAQETKTAEPMMDDTGPCKPGASCATAGGHCPPARTAAGAVVREAGEPKRPAGDAGVATPAKRSKVALQ